MKKWLRAALHFALFFLAMAMFLVTYITASMTRTNYGKTVLNRGWTVKVNNKDVYEDVDLSSFHITDVKRGDWFVLTNIIPEDYETDLVMLMGVAYSITDIYIGGEKVFSYGYEDYANNQLVGSGNRFVDIGDDYRGRSVKITMLVTETDAFSTLSPPVFYDSLHSYDEYLRERTLPLSIALTLIVLGFAVMVVTISMYFKAFSVERLFCVGVFSLCMGCWSLCNYDLDIFFTSSLRLKSYMEFMALYLAPIPMLMYFREDVESRGNKWEVRLYYVLVFSLLQLFIILSCFNYLGIMHYLRFFWVYMGIMVLLVVYSTILIFKDVMAHKGHILLAWGIVLLLIISMRDIIGFGLMRSLNSGGNQDSFHTYTAAGAFVFVMAMLADFISEVRRTSYMEAENRLLTRLAYNDVLTGLSTRRRCEEVFEEIQKSNRDYAVVQFDLNNLKTINDSFGHEAGDDLIKNFADLLKLVFDKNEIIGRMGGDEFVVAVRDMKNYKIDYKLATLDLEIAKYNDVHKDRAISVSYGYCISTEVENADFKEVYALADQRMYAEKEKYYRERGFGRRKNDQTN